MRILAALVLAISLLAPVRAQCDEIDIMNIELCKQVMARMFCKSPQDFNMVAKVREGLFLLSTFYANKETQFFCGIGGGYIRVQGREFRTMTHTIPYVFDMKSKCSVVNYSSPDCPNSSPIVVCAQKTLDEQSAQDFWNRPIPDLLDEDLKRALDDLNATKPEQPENVTPEPPKQ
mgnify:CR=1 FL=1